MQKCDTFRRTVMYCPVSYSSTELLMWLAVSVWLCHVEDRDNFFTVTMVLGVIIV